MSDFSSWKEAEHVEDWLLFPENMGEYLSIDETSLSQGELHTILTNKSVKGRKGALIAMIKGTESDRIIDILLKMGESVRKKVKKVTLNLAPTMERIVKKSFLKAKMVADRFHVQQLASDAVQQIRIDH